MNEAETRAELIDPALREAGWGLVADSRLCELFPSREIDVRAKLFRGGRYKAVGDATDCLDHETGVQRDDAVGANPTRGWQRPGQHIHCRNGQAVLRLWPRRDGNGGFPVDSRPDGTGPGGDG